MLHRMAVFSSDQINAYGIRMPIRTLAEALEQSWDLGQPVFLSHDRHRLEGWTRTLGLYLEPGMARLTGICFSPETEHEAKQLKQGFYQFLGRQLQAMVAPYQPELESRLGEHLRGGEHPIYMSCAALVGDGLAERAYPEAFADRDKDGLVPRPNHGLIAPGVYERNGLLYFASNHMRRSLSRHNTLNASLLSRLDDLAREENVSVRLRLDPDAVGLASTYMQPLEFAYWWGPKFSDDLLKIPLGITRHEASDRHRMFSGVQRTEFWWHAQNDLKTLECEEVLDIPSLGAGPGIYGCRYVHSIVDSDLKTPFHLDGAVRMYDDDSMLARMESNIRDAGRHTKYVKQWRVDGVIPIHVWKELVADYFRDNELVGEYLGGVDDNENLRPRLLRPDADPLSRYVPCNMAAGSGVRLSVSYHRPPDEPYNGVKLQPMDSYGTDDERTDVVESDTFEIVKLLRRRGIDVAIPDGVSRLAYEDTTANLALILHGGAEPAKLAEDTLFALKSLCNVWATRGDDRIVSFNVGVVYGDRCVRFSFAGHVVDLHALFERFGIRLPHDTDAIPGWMEEIYDCLSGLAPESLDQPSLDRMLQETGILIYARTTIPRTLYELKLPENAPPEVHFRIPKTDSALIKLLEDGDLGWSPIHIVEESVCSVCKHDYLACNCSKYLDSAVKQVMKRAPVADLFWTNRPASDRVRLAINQPGNTTS